MKVAVATALAAAVTSASLRKSNLVDTVSLSAGDDLSVKFVSGPEQQGVLQFGFLLTATVEGESAIFGGGSGTTTQYHPFGTVKSAVTLADASVIVAAAGVIDRIYIRESVAPGVGNTWRYTLYVNGSPTSLTVDLSGTNQTTNTSGNPVTVAQGDLIALKREAFAGTPASSTCRFGARWVPTVPGESLLFNIWTTVSVGADRFGNVNGQTGNSATESQNYNLVPYPCVLKKKVLNFTTAPGSGKSRFILLRKGLVGGSQSDTTLSTNVTDTNTSATPDNTHEITISASDVATGALIDFKTNGVGVAAAPGNMRDGMVAYIPIAATGTGALASGSSAGVGVGVSKSTGTSALHPSASVAHGVGVSKSTGTGALHPSVGAVSGVGLSASVGVGTLTPAAAQVHGAAVSSSSGAGNIVLSDADVTGAGLSLSVGSGALVAQPLTLFGAGGIGTVGSGDLLSSVSSLSGSGIVIVVVPPVVFPPIIRGSGGGGGRRYRPRIEFKLPPKPVPEPEPKPEPTPEPVFGSGELVMAASAVEGRGVATHVAVGELDAIVSAVEGRGDVAYIAAGVIAASNTQLLGLGFALVLVPDDVIDPEAEELLLLLSLAA